jgi:dihydropteroate synthase
VLSASARLGSVRVGGGSPVRIMAAINVSPESFYKGSVADTAEEVTTRVRKAVADGADLIDIGGASTAPYLRGGVGEEVERSRAVAGVKAALDGTSGRAAVSVDTVRASVAEAALRSGASVVNDVSGLKADPAMPKVVRERGASLLAMAHHAGGSKMGPIPLVSRSLRQTLKIAERGEIDRGLIVVDPGIGFFRDSPGSATSSHQSVMPWYEWDCEVIANLGMLDSLGRPIGVGVSRKSFLGKILGIETPEERLVGSLAVTAIAVANGAQLVRTHDVRETLQAVRAAEAVRARSPKRRPLS